jgi:hypothetical protein
MCEQVKFSLQAILASDPYHGKWCVLQVDIKNAFNSVHRSSILEAVGRQADNLLPWTQQSLQSSTLFLGEYTLVSSEGGQQRAPLSPLFFSLAIHDALTSCPPTAANYWYLDDGTIIGDLPCLRQCMAHIKPRLAAVGSIIDIGKTHIWGPGAPDCHLLESLAPEDPLYHIPIVPYDIGSGVQVGEMPPDQKGKAQSRPDEASSSRPGATPA